jgi:hypothetical protein
MTMPATLVPADHRSGRNPNAVVAAILTCGDRIGLFRRSASVTGDIGRWHCITGFLPTCEDPLRQALLEVEEETGILERELELRGRTVLDLTGADGSRWRVHAFHFHSRTDSVKLNWEHDASCWALPDQISRFPTVVWLMHVLKSLRESVPEALSASV